MARTHTLAARTAGARLAAIASSTPERAASAAAQLGYEQALAPDELLAQACRSCTSAPPTAATSATPDPHCEPART